MRSSVVLCLLLSAFPACAQSDLATTRDGSTLYFSGSEGNVFQQNIYRWTRQSGVALFARQPSLPDLNLSLGYRLSGTQVTSDGGAVLYQAEGICAAQLGPFSRCPPGDTIVVVSPVQPFPEHGYLLVSPNGRYGVSWEPSRPARWIDWFTGDQAVIDVGSYSIPGLAPGFSAKQRALADDGTFLILAENAVRIWSRTGERMLTFSGSADNASISADGNTVAVQAQEPQGNISYTYVTDLRAQRTIKFSDSAKPVDAALLRGMFSIGDDGQLVAYPASGAGSPPGPRQAVLARPDGSERREITNAPEDVAEVVLSGDGRVVFAATVKGRVLRYDVAAGSIEELLPGSR